jgi:hypothetical protein
VIYFRKTIQEFKIRPATLQTAINNTDNHGFFKKLFIYKKTLLNRSPQDAAIRFYLANNILSDVVKVYQCNETLPDDVWLLINKCYKIYNDEGIRLIVYLMFICLRELRYHRSFTGVTKNTIISNNDKNLISQDHINYLYSACVDANVDVLSAVEKNLPPGNLGTLITAIEYMFLKGDFIGRSYGGESWGFIANCLKNFIFGVSSLELLLDAGFNLAHNNGPIFDKDLVYVGYNCIQLLNILDIQLLGQIPNYILHNLNLKRNKNIICRYDLYLLTSEAKNILGLKYDDGVDWDQLFLLKSLKKETKTKTIQC